VLRDASTEQQRGRAVITSARVDRSGGAHLFAVYGDGVPNDPSGSLSTMSIARTRARAGAPNAPVSTLSLPVALLRTARPKQWVKNVLVFAAPAAAGVLDEASQLGRTAIAFVALCLAASGTYFLNDALDVHADREHPTKRNRPVAAGHVSERAAIGVSIVLILAALGVAAPLNDGKLAAVVGGYVVLTVSYSIWLKHEPVVDLGAVAAGFVLRAIAGGMATGVEISDWFLIVAAGGSLFMVTGKRHAEQIELGEGSGAHRSTLEEYSASYLSFVRAVAGSLTVTAYILWAFENAAKTGDETWFRLSIVPFVLAILRYAHLIEQGRGGAPEELVLSDRVLQVLALLWAAAFAIGVHV
jgi:decaprenyl-phosphate phosphoribosyltransferase